ncbi:MAG TPA: hypothetical protein VJI75_02545 [Candidatus Nanoarchaeia archaeon]|nr:hypothetical protein [Candidatus Nanoarchaeia archaeon]
MTYLSQSGNDSGGCSGSCCGSRNSLSSMSYGNEAPASFYSARSPLENVISSYSGSSLSMRETIRETYSSSRSGSAGYSSSSFFNQFTQASSARDSGNSNGILAEDSFAGKYLAGISYALKGLVDQKYFSGYKQQKNSESHFSPDSFLKPQRPAAPFIGKAEDVQHYVREAFRATTGKRLPEDISINVVNKEEMRRAHENFGGIWSEGIQGFSINRKGFSQSIIVVKENDLDRLLITIGHEIGHVLSFPLLDKLDEEAKAFAFEHAWLEALRDNDIANLSESIQLSPHPGPARNGLHDLASGFVQSLVSAGIGAMEIFNKLIHNQLSARGGA